MVTLVTLAATHHSSMVDPSDSRHLLPLDVDDNRPVLAAMTHLKRKNEPFQEATPESEVSEERSAGLPVRLKDEVQEQRLQDSVLVKKMLQDSTMQSHGDVALVGQSDGNADAETPSASPSEEAPSAAPETAPASYDAPGPGEAPAFESAAAPEEAYAEAPEEASSDAPEEASAEAPEEAYAEAPEEAYAEAPEKAYAEAPQEAYAEAPEKAYAEAPQEAYAEALQEAYAEAPQEAYAEAPEEAPIHANEEATADAPEEAPEHTSTTDEAERLVKSSEAVQNYTDILADHGPPLTTKDEGFEDATWATDDYRTPYVSTKDPGALNRLDPVVNAPGEPSTKTTDPVMKQTLKDIEHNKKKLAKSLHLDTDSFNSTEFIHELVSEGIVLAPDEEPERSKKTSGGNYLDGKFDEEDLERIVGDNSTADAEERDETTPELEEVEGNVKEEVPLAEPFGEDEASALAGFHTSSGDEDGDSATVPTTASSSNVALSSTEDDWDDPYSHAFPSSSR